MTRTVSTDVTMASSVLAMFSLVRRDLELMRPQVGHIKTQALAAFARHEPKFVTLVTADLRRAYGEPAAKVAAGAVGEVASHAAATALAAGMDIQLARGWAPDVAWERALVAYGLNGSGMHAHLATALSGDPKQAVGVVPPAARTAVKRALIAYATKLAQEGVAAARVCSRATISKDYDPNQPREEHGRWTAGPARAKTKTKPTEPDAVDELLSSMPSVDAVTPSKSRYETTGKSPYETAATAGSPYKTSPYARSRYAADTYAGGDGPSRYDRAALGGNLPREQPKRRTWIVVTGTPAEQEEAAEEALDAEGSGRGGFYLPMSSLDKYYRDPFNLHAGGDVDTRIDFAGVQEYYRNANDPSLDDRPDFDDDDDYIFSDEPPENFTDAPGDFAEGEGPTSPIELRYHRSVWGVATGVEVGDNEWKTLVNRALPLHQKVLDDPYSFAIRLEPAMLNEIGDEVGMGTASPTQIKERIAHDMDVYQLDSRFDPSLLNAVADYVVWRQPKYLGEEGKQFGNMMRDIGVDMDVNQAAPAVMSFPRGLHDDDDASDMTGEYVSRATVYHSALAEKGFAAPHGVIGIREVVMHPDRV